MSSNPTTLPMVIPGAGKPLESRRMNRSTGVYIDGFEKFGGDDVLINRARHAVVEADAVRNKIVDAHEAHMADPTRPVVGRFVAAKQSATKSATRIVESLTDAHAKLVIRAGNAIDTLKRIKPPEPKNAPEIRTYLRGLDATARTDLLYAAEADSDTDTLGAVLGAAPYLSGATGEMLEGLRSRYAEKINPDAVAQRDVSLDACQWPKMALDSFEQDVVAFYDDPAVNHAAALATKAAES